MVDQNSSTLFNDIYDSTNRKVLTFIASKCRDTTDIQDIFQDTYMELYRVLSRRGDTYVENPEAFVMKLARQKLYRHYTFFERVKFMISSVSTDHGDEMQFIDELDIEEEFLTDEVVRDIQNRLKTKSLDIQKIFFLYYSMDMTIPEISKALSMGESNVKNKLYRTLKELRVLYSEKDGEKIE